MIEIDRRFRNRLLLVSFALYLLVTVASVYEYSWISPALVPLVFLPVVVVAKLARWWPEVLDSDALRLRTPGISARQAKRKLQHDLAGQVSIAAPADGALSIPESRIRTEDRDRGRRG